jgi:hypothetical protein
VKVLLFLLVPILAVTAYAVWVWARNREPSSVESGVDAFRREMTALSPDAAPVQRRPERSPEGPGGAPRQARRRPSGSGPGSPRPDGR